MIGLGLGDHKDITIKGAEAIKAADRVFLEMYTSVLGVDVAALVRISDATSPERNNMSYPK